MAMNAKTFARGQKTRKDVIGGAAALWLEGPAGAADRDQQDYVTELAWGEIFSRPGLGKKTRILLNLAMLTVMGERDVLKHHIGGALRLGCTRTAIREALLQAGTFAGLNKVSLATMVAQEVFAEADAANRARRAQRSVSRAKAR